jgi:small subunit ribosomal protein S4
MARYTGPVCKLCRRAGEKLLLKGERCMTPKCAIERRSYGPGSHGQRRSRKPSEYSLQLREKQKARWTYGLMERQFRKHFAEAESRPGVTGENLLQILESRLDNTIYRLGYGESRPESRQLVRHGHFTVNGRKTNIPSYATKPGDVIGVREESKGSEYFKTLPEALEKRAVPDWLSLDAKTLTGTVVRLPRREEIEISLNDALIVEFYSR